MNQASLTGQTLTQGESLVKFLYKSAGLILHVLGDKIQNKTKQNNKQNNKKNKSKVFYVTMSLGCSKMQTLLQNQKLVKAYKKVLKNLKAYEFVHYTHKLYSYISVSYITIGDLLSWCCMKPGGKRVKYFCELESSSDWAPHQRVELHNSYSYYMLFSVSLYDSCALHTDSICKICTWVVTVDIKTQLLLIRPRHKGWFLQAVSWKDLCTSCSSMECSSYYSYRYHGLAALHCLLRLIPTMFYIPLVVSLAKLLSWNSSPG